MINSSVFRSRRPVKHQNYQVVNDPGKADPRSTESLSLMRITVMCTIALSHQLSPRSFRVDAAISLHMGIQAAARHTP